MAEEKYVCKRCGKTFETKPEAGKTACPVCGSQECAKADQAAPSSCAKNARFS